MVKLPEVLVQPEAPPEAIVKTPVELPRLVAAVPVALMLAVPVIVTQPAPSIKPLPELTPTAVTAPAWVTEKLVEVIRLAPKAPEKLRPLVMLAPVILMASVTVSWLPVAVSLLARSSKAETVASVEEESF